MSSLCSLVSDLFTRHLFLMNRRSRKKQKHLVLQEPRLPTEILATIINEVASDTEDKHRTLATLAACRLASYTLCSLTTPLFFSSIHLTDSVGPWAKRKKRLKGSKLLSKRAKNLNDILRIDDIANSVKTLTLRCDTLNFASRPNAVLISKILHHRLPHIQMFALEADIGWGGVSLSCLDMPKPFVSGIQALCKSPHLTTLHIHNVYDFPITAIAACPNLQRLRLWHAVPHFDCAYSINETSRMQLLHLDSLEIDHVTIYYRPLDNFTLANLFCPRLKNLQIKNLFCGGIMDEGWDVILLAAQTLTTLHLLSDIPIDDRDEDLEDLLEDGIPLDLNRLPALRHFKIQEQSSSEHNLSLLTFLNQLLSTSTPSSGIETLGIDITWVGVDVGCGKNLFLSDLGWSTLDELLTSKKFVSLRKVVLSLGLEMEEKEKLESERNLTLPYVNALFPKLRALADTHRTLEIHLEVSRRLTPMML